MDCFERLQNAFWEIVVLNSNDTKDCLEMNIVKVQVCESMTPLAKE